MNGDATFRSLFEGIDSAGEHVLAEYDVVHDDGIGRERKARLVERAKAGIRVRFLYDEIGSHDLPRARLARRTGPVRQRVRRAPRRSRHDPA